jgi:hypothetical protein
VMLGTFAPGMLVFLMVDPQADTRERVEVTVM